MARQSVRRLAVRTCIACDSRSSQVPAIGPAQRAEFPQSHSSACPSIRGTTVAKNEGDEALSFRSPRANPQNPPNAQNSFETAIARAR